MCGIYHGRLSLIDGPAPPTVSLLRDPASLIPEVTFRSFLPLTCNRTLLKVLHLRHQSANKTKHIVTILQMDLQCSGRKEYTLPASHPCNQLISQLYYRLTLSILLRPVFRLLLSVLTMPLYGIAIFG